MPKNTSFVDAGNIFIDRWIIESRDISFTAKGFYMEVLGRTNAAGKFLPEALEMLRDPKNKKIVRELLDAEVLERRDVIG